MRYSNHRAEPYFSFLKNGQKIIEGRLRRGKYAKIKTGDLITVYNQEETDQIEVRVKRVTPYKSIREMLSKEYIKKFLPDVDTIDEGIEIYKKFYTPGEEKKFGVVAIEVSKIGI